MAFKTIKINERDPKCFGERLKFDLKVNISQDGQFTAYLPDDIAVIFNNAGMELLQNPTRRSKEGFFSSNTLHGLQEDIKKVIAEYFSMTPVESKKVIRYIIRTTCCYGINNKNEIAPNCDNKWIDGTSELVWKDGTEKIDNMSSHPYGLLVYADVFTKQTFKYKSGKVYIEYNQVDDIKDGSYADKLSSFIGICVPDYDEDNLQEIDYTEEAARFFVELLISICRLNENIKDKLDPKGIMEIIASQQKLLPMQS